MNSAIKVQQFLRRKLEENHLEKKYFSSESGIPYSTLCKIINGAQRNTELKTIVKIANYFNCSLDEVTGRNPAKGTKEAEFNKLSTEEMGGHLKKFLGNKLTELSLNSYQLAKKCGFSDVALYEFMQDNTTKKAPGSTIIIGLADYFKISLDEMVGRTTTTAANQSIIPEALKGLNLKDLVALQQAKKSIDSNLSKNIDGQIHKAPKRNKTSLVR